MRQAEPDLRGSLHEASVSSQKPRAGTGRSRRGAACAAFVSLLLGLSLGLPRELPAQATWEYSPYSVKVWLAMDSAAELTAGLAERIDRAISNRAWIVAGATWQVKVAACPAARAFDVARHPALVTVDAVQALAPDLVKQDDKLFLLGIRDELTGMTIAVRELDCRTRLWQPVITRHVAQPSRVADEAFVALIDACVPCGRIESAKGKEAVVRVRAEGLITGERSPARIAAQDVRDGSPLAEREDYIGGAASTRSGCGCRRRFPGFRRADRAASSSLTQELDSNSTSLAL